MFSLGCAQVNEDLISECESLIMIALETVAGYIKLQTKKHLNDVHDIEELFRKRPLTTE